MSYDISLKDRVTGETLHTTEPHMMTGGTYAIGGTTEMWLNITYNYSHYYYEATEGDARFANDGGDGNVRYGIRGIYGKTGAESIPMLRDMIANIENRYKRDGEWISTKREKAKHYDGAGIEISQSEALSRAIHGDEVFSSHYVAEVNEGPNADYWEPTAANAISPLYKLLAFAQMRPDGVWDGD